MNKNIKFLITISIGVIFTSMVSAQDGSTNETTFTFGGYAKMDVLFSRFNNGEVADASPMRDFYFPALIPVGIERKYDYTDFHVKESRFNFDLRSTLEGHNLRTFVELDFMLSGVGNEKISNSFNPRLRHFFFEYDNFLVGQTWSTFMTVILPETIDFIGAPEGMVFIRQPQIRFSKGSWQFAIENPTTTVTNYHSTVTRLTSSGGAPDVVVRRNVKGEWGTVSMAGMFRNLNLMDSVGIKRYTSGYGVSLGGKFLIGKDDIRLMVTAGSGLGRYVGLNFITSSVLCEKSELHSINTINGYLAYKHQWSPKFKSTVDASVFYADHEGQYIDRSINKSVWSASANLLYTPVQNVLFGIEYMHAERELQNGTLGSFERIQFSGKYRFKYSSK